MASLPSSGFGLWRTAVNSFNGSADNNPSYIMDLACDASELHAAVAGSEFDLKLYERETLRCSATLATEAHSDRINELSHAPTGSAVAGTFFSASSDGHVRGWDATVPPRAGCSLDFRGKDEVWSVSASDGALVATGTQTAIVLWDVRKPGSPFARLEVHTEPVTAVRFQPGSATALVSGSIDELICSIDCRQSTDDDAVTCILSTGRPVSRLGFFGPSPASHLYVLSSLETLSVWDLRDAGACISTYDSLRRQPDMLDEDEAQASPLGDGIDYLVGCQYEEDTNRLYLLAGEHVGTLHVLAVEQSAAVAVASLRGGAAGGHASDVRCFHWGKKSLLTGGEDARLCLWGAASDARAAGAPVGAAAGTSRKAERAGEKTQRRAAPY